MVRGGRAQHPGGSPERGSVLIRKLNARSGAELVKLFLETGEDGYREALREWAAQVLAPKTRRIHVYDTRTPAWPSGSVPPESPKWRCRGCDRPRGQGATHHWSSAWCVTCRGLGITNGWCGCRSPLRANGYCKRTQILKLSRPLCRRRHKRPWGEVPCEPSPHGGILTPATKTN